MEEAGGYPVPKQLNIDRNLYPASFFLTASRLVKH